MYFAITSCTLIVFTQNLDTIGGGGQSNALVFVIFEKIYGWLIDLMFCLNLLVV